MDKRLLLLISFYFMTTAVLAADPNLDPTAKHLKSILTNKCASCHVDGGEEVPRFGDFTNTQNFLKRMDLANPKNSIVYKKVLSGAMPRPDYGDSLTEDERR